MSVFWRGSTARSKWWGHPVSRCSVLRDDAIQAITMVTTDGSLPAPFFFFSPPPHNARSCVRCVAMQTSPAATVKISMEEVWTPSRLKGEEGDRKQAEKGGGEVGGQTGDLLLHMLFFVLLMYQLKILNTRIVTFFLVYSLRFVSIYVLQAWCYFCFPKAFINKSSVSEISPISG